MLEVERADDSCPDAAVDDEEDDAASMTGSDDDWSRKAGAVLTEGCTVDVDGMASLGDDGIDDEAVQFGSDGPVLVLPLMDIGVRSRIEVGAGEGEGELDFVCDLLRCLFSGGALVIETSALSSLTTASRTTGPAVSAEKVSLIGGNCESDGGTICFTGFRFEGDFFGDGGAPEDRLWLEFDRDIERDARSTTGFGTKGLGVTGTEGTDSLRSALSFLPALCRWSNMEDIVRCGQNY